MIKTIEIAPYMYAPALARYLEECQEEFIAANGEIDYLDLVNKILSFMLDKNK